MHIDFADKSVSQSISPKVPKYQFDTLDCSLEELAGVVPCKCSRKIPKNLLN